MSKELEKVNEIHTRAIYKADGTTVIESGLFNLLVAYAKKALQRLEAIDNSTPSEALECLERIEADLVGLPKHVTEYDDTFDDYLDDIEDNVDTIKQALLKQLESKHYLKWEDLEFKEEKQMMTVLLNGTKYTLIVSRNILIDKLALLRNGEINYFIDDKQFFNDLHLERVEE